LEALANSADSMFEEVDERAAGRLVICECSGWRGIGVRSGRQLSPTFACYLVLLPTVDMLTTGVIGDVNFTSHSKSYILYNILSRLTISKIHDHYWNGFTIAALGTHIPTQHISGITADNGSNVFIGSNTTNNIINSET
jgi:hypothetical protein